MPQTSTMQKPVRAIPAVLMVDDDEIDVMGVKREFLRSKLKNPIVVANNGLEALEKLRNGSVPSPRMVLLDLNMPRMNGIEFLQEIRRDPDLKETIIFVLTTSKAMEDKQQAYEHNIAGYIVKDCGNGGFVDTAELLNCYSRTVEFP